MSVVTSSRLMPVLGFSVYSLISSGSVFAQEETPDVSPECVNRIPVVQSDGTVEIDLSTYLANGVSPAPDPEGAMAGNLDSCVWQVESKNSGGNTVTVEFEQSSSDTFFGHSEMNQNRLEQKTPPGGLYFYQANNNQTVIWVKPRANIFSPGTLTARFNISSMPLADLMLGQRLYFYRRNNTESSPVTLDFSYYVGSSFDESALRPAFSDPFNTMMFNQQLSIESRCYRVSIDKALLRSGRFLYLTWSVDDASDGAMGVRDDIGFDPVAPVLDQSQGCLSFTVSESETMTTVSSMPTISPSVSMPGSGTSSFMPASSPAPMPTSSPSSSMPVPSVSVDATETPPAGSAGETRASVGLGLTILTLAMALVAL